MIFFQRAAEETKKNAVAVAVTCGLVFLLVYLWQDPCDGRKILANLVLMFLVNKKFCLDRYINYSQ